MRKTPILSLFLGILALVLLTTAHPVLAASVATPLQASGLVPVWQENFTNGSLDRMQYVFTKGDNSALTSLVLPGAVYLGKQGGTTQVEQEINNFKLSADEALPHTLEFDVLSPNTGSARVSLRPRRRGDMVNFMLGLTGNKTQVRFREDSVAVKYNEPSGPSYGWAHCVISYRQFVKDGTVYADFVVSINEEVREHVAKSGITNPDWETYWKNTANADGWSIEHNSTDVLMGKYIANLRAYADFISLSDMQARLSGRVKPHLASLSDPRNYQGPTKTFQRDYPLLKHGPNPMAYAAQTGPLTLAFDGTLSSDWDKITAFKWNFGDGATGSGRLVTHTYAQEGTYKVTLTVTSHAGTKSQTISVKAEE